MTVPGIGGSGPDHWQTHWDAELPATRIAPASWDRPDPRDWSAAISRAVAAPGAGSAPPGAAPGPDRVVLIAHSLGALAASAWLVERGPGPVVGAMLVAVPDPDGPAFPEAARGFTARRAPLPVPTLVVVSDDDPYAGPAWARGLALDWGAAVADVGPLGHVNATSGVGAWDQGRALLRSCGAVRDAEEREG
ncbi:alpha/beta hydrolase [Xylanimonas ulmi]